MPDNWNIYARKIVVLETSYQPRISKLLDAQIKLFVSNLKTDGKDAALSALQSSLIDVKLLNLLTNLYKRAGLMGARMTVNELKIAAKKEQKAAGFGTNPQFIEAVVTYLQQYGLEMVQNITETTREFISKILARSQSEGWSLEKTVEELQRQDYTEARARRIARTEIVRAANVGHAEGARTSPFEVNKKWVSAKDHRTRHSHQKMNGQMIDEDALFKVPIADKDRVITGYEDMTSPGDPKASPSNTVNCRCRITHVPKRDAQGNLIPRRATARIIPFRANPPAQYEDIRRAIAASIKMLPSLD